MTHFLKCLLLILCCASSLLPAAAQQPQGTYIIKSAANQNLVLDTEGRHHNYGYSVFTVVRPNSNSSNQRFVITPAQDGKCYISQGYSYVSIFTRQPGQGVDLFLDLGRDAHTMWIAEYSNGAYIFRSAMNRNYVMTTGDNRNVFLWEYHGGNNQRWYLEKVNVANTAPAAPVHTPAPQQPTSYPCGVCNHTGRCSNCHGSGVSPNHAPGIHARCGACGGTGRCATCHGTGYHN